MHVYKLLEIRITLIHHHSLSTWGEEIERKKIRKKYEDRKTDREKEREREREKEREKEREREN